MNIMIHYIGLQDTYLSSQLTRLQLDLSHNRLTAVPPELGNISTLQDVCENFSDTAHKTK